MFKLKQNKSIVFTVSVLLFMFLHTTIHAADTLYINRDTLTITPVFFQKAALNNDTVFNAENAVLDYPLGATIDLTIINNDTVPHSVRLPNSSGTVNILAGLSASVSLIDLPMGTFLMPVESSVGSFLGAGALIRVGINGQKFAWDLWDQDPDLTEDFGSQTISQLPNTYRPTLFTINGSVDPMDPTNGSIITGNVGDTIYISIANNGNMDHPMHFHGYHVKIIQATKQPHMVGWSKDSFPVLAKEAMTVMLVPHQPGEYPVHNHNLIATLFNNGYPKGMITMLMIEE